MTPWHFAAGYLLLGIVFIVGTFLVQLIESLGSPPVRGHLEPKFSIGDVGRWVLMSCVIVSPFVIAFADDWPEYYDQFMERWTWMLSMHVAVTLIWVVRLQLQIVRLQKQNDNVDDAE